MGQNQHHVTEGLTKKWAIRKSKNSTSVLLYNSKTNEITPRNTDGVFSFLDQWDKETEGYFNDTIENFYLNTTKKINFENFDTEQKGKILLFFWLQIGRYSAPKDGNNFLIKFFKPLTEHPGFLGFFGNFLTLSLYKINKGKINLPEQGIIVLNTKEGEYIY